MRSHRAEVLELMQIVHRMPLDVAEYFVAEMDDVEIERRFQMYTGMEFQSSGGASREQPVELHRSGLALLKFSKDLRPVGPIGAQ